MSYDVPEIPGEKTEDVAFGQRTQGWPLWEVFVRAKRGLNHAPDAEVAVQNARDSYTRRAEGVSIWVVPSTEIHASDDAESFFEPMEDRPYRHPTFYEIPSEVGQM